jgi:3-hydroxyisobutyrate dehydrogenase-like beta-hydroxyacid dehydrogenase
MKIGFVGLGDMGLGIVPRLLAAGHSVTGWNRTKSKAEPLQKLGMAWADTPREVAAQSEVVFSIVTDSAAVQAVALAEKGGVPREVAVDAMLKSVVASPVLGYRGPFILEGKMPAVPLADVTLQQKDMSLVLELGRKMEIPVPLAAAANEMMNACRGLGLGHHDFVIAHEAYRRLGGMSK